MIGKQDILNIVRKVMKLGRGGRKSRVRASVRDWFIGLFVALIVAAAMVAYDVTLFSRYSSLETRVEQTTQKEVKLDDETAEAVLDEFRAREAEFQRLRAFGNPNAAAAPATTESLDATDSDEESAPRSPDSFFEVQ